MAYSDFLAQIRRTLEEPIEGVWANESIRNWTNRGTLDLARRTRMERNEEYTTTQVGAQSYELPSMNFIPIAAYYDNKRLQRIAIEDMYDLEEQNGTPHFYAIVESDIYLFPTPDAEKELRFFRYYKPTPIEGDTDEMPFDGDYDDALEAYVLARCFEQINDMQTSAYYRSVYEAEFLKAEGEEGIKRQTGRSRAPVEVY